MRPAAPPPLAVQGRSKGPHVQHAQINANQAEVNQAQANLELAQVTWGRDKPLVKQGWATAQQGTIDVQNLKAQQAVVENAQAALKLAQRQMETLKAQRASAEANVKQAEAQRDQAQLEPFLYDGHRRPARPRSQPLRRGRRICVARDRALDVRAGRHLGDREFQGDPARSHAAGPAGDASRSTPIPIATSAATSPASSPAPAPPSRCCRPRTPPATTSRSSSACRSRSSWTIRRPTSRSARACRSCRPFGSIPAARSMRG